MGNLLNVAIIGAGEIGKLHTDVCSRFNNLNISAVVDLDEKTGKELADNYKARFYNDIDKLLKNEKLDIAAICTPTFSHKNAVEKIASSGINIFCEKPLALSLEEADIMVETVRRNKVKAIVAHVLRFWPEYCKTKEIIEKNELGSVMHIQCERLCGIKNCDKSTWKTQEDKSCGAGLDMQIHDMDFLIWVFGEPVFIDSCGVYKKELGGWSHINTILKFKNDVNGFINAGWDMAEGFPFTMVLRVVCEKGVIEWIYRSEKGYKGREKKFPLIIYKSDGSNYEVNVEKADPYYREWEYFINCITNNQQVKNSTFEDARLSLFYTLKTLKY